MIPKILHRVHLGPEESQLVKDAWQIAKDIHPEWECITHNELSLDNFPIVRDYLDFSQKYSFKSDLMRFEALYNWGGVYIDTDIFCIKSFNNIIDLGSIVVGYEDDIYLGAAVIAATPKNPKVLAMLQDMILNLEEEGKENFVYAALDSIVFGPRIIAKHLMEDQEAIKLSVDYFYPIGYEPEHTNPVHGSENAEQYVQRVLKHATNNTVCSHKWAHSWR